MLRLLQSLAGGLILLLPLRLPGGLCRNACFLSTFVTRKRKIATLFG